MENKEKNQVRAIWAILCKNAAVDQQTNQLSIFSILEDLKINKKDPSAELQKVSEFSQKTAIPHEHALVVLFERESDNKKELTQILRLDIFDPKGNVLIKNENPVKFEAGKSRLRAIINLNNFIATKPGLYKYIVSIKNPDGSVDKKVTTSVNVSIYE